MLENDENMLIVNQNYLGGYFTLKWDLLSPQLRKINKMLCISHSSASWIQTKSWKPLKFF